jgi:Flp pilus assembly protein TadD/predicted Zn-dependent protease with MMP-like domain
VNLLTLFRASARVAVACAAIASAGCRDPGAAPDPAEAFDAGAAPFDAAATPADAGDEARVPHAHVPCPASPAVLDDPDALFDLAAVLAGQGEHAASLSCAQRAAELVPPAVEAHQLRAAALAALDRHEEARVAFSMALALDPDDPDTLAAAADYYINDASAKRHEAIELGLAYARRGAANVTERWRQDDPVHGQLLLLEGQALNDLGRPGEALRVVERALELAEPPVDALHERGVSLLNLGRFEEAEAAFARFLEEHEESPRAPFARWHLGLIHERRGDDELARAEFARAAASSGGALREPLVVSEAEFSAELEAAIASLPSGDRELLARIELEVVDLPAAEDLEGSPPLAPTILGLARGLAYGEKEPAATGDAQLPPDRAIVLYRKNLARVVADRAELGRILRDTLRHEIGHVRGLSEADLRHRGLE